MDGYKEMGFAPQSFAKRLNSMLRADARRMFTSSLFYIMLGVCLVMPVLILVMTTMMDGTAAVDPNTGAVTTVEAFKNTWQIIASPSGEGSMAGMDLTGMCNINLVYFLAGVFVCLFVAEDFTSGYVKNLFTVRAGKTDYVASKSILCFLAGALFLAAFFLGAALGGAVSGLPFDLGSAGIGGLVMCMLAKIFLMAVFVAIALAVSAGAKRKSWLSILLFLFAGMLLFMMIPMMTPLDAGPMNVLLCLAGGAVFAAALGGVSGLLLQKRDLV